MHICKHVKVTLVCALAALLSVAASGCGGAGNSDAADEPTAQEQFSLAQYAAGSTIQAEALTSKSSPDPQLENNNTDVGVFNAGTWFCFDNVDLTGVPSLDLRMAALHTGGVFSVRIDGNAGTEIGRYTVATATGGWTTWETRTMPIAATSGVHSLCFRGETNSGILNLDWLKLNQPAVSYKVGATIQAEALTSKSSPNPQLENSNTDVGFFDAGTWFCFAGVDLTNVASLDLRLAAANTGGVFTARLDSGTGTEIGRYTVATATGGWSTWQTRTMALTQTAGVHTLCLHGETNAGICNVDSLKLNPPNAPPTCPSPPTVGANTPFITLEAEAATVGGGASVVSLTTPTTEFSSPELEASGHAFVKLAGQGQFVQWTNTTCFSVTAVNIRASIPDSAGGGGINATLDLYVNGAMRQAIKVSSTQTWVYETASTYNGMSQAPSAGYPHVFWDEYRTFITGAAVPPGGTIMLKVDSANTAAFYYIDAVDVEAPPPPLAQPANSLSINSYGAVANSPATDNAQAIRSCIVAAQSAGKSVWIPSGTYYANVNTSIGATGVTISGAGPWYSTILDVATTGTIVFHTKGASIQNLYINATRAMTTQDQIYAVLGEGDNWTLDNLSVSHAMLTWGTGNNIVIKNCRVNNSWGDGLNMNQGGSGLGCSHLTVTNNFARGNGDDGITLNSSNNNAPNMSYCAYTHNTSVASWWANEMGIYGGVGDIIEYNLLQDSVKLNGLRLGSFGNGGPGSSMVGALIMGNNVVRGGSYGYANKNPGLLFGGGGATNNVLSTNTIINAMFNGMDYSTQNGSVAQYNTIIAPGLTGIGVYWGGVSGNATSINNTVTNLNAGQVAFLNNDANYKITPGTPAASYSGKNSVVTESCAEGGQDIGSITNGSYTYYAGINLAGATFFNTRVASAGVGGSIQIRLDSPTGTVIGTCAVPVTGGWQNWTTKTCGITATSGTHTIYLVYTGGAGSLFNVEWFSFP